MEKGKRKGGLFGGGGMPGSTQMLLKQASKVQAKMAENRERFSRLLFTGTAGGGALKVTVRGDFTVTDVSLDEDMYKAMSYDDMEYLIRGAVGEALKQIKNAENGEHIKAESITFDVTLHVLNELLYSPKT